MKEQMTQKIENDEIRTNIGGGAYWLATGIYLDAEEAEALAQTDFPFSLEETIRAHGIQAKRMAEETAEQAEATRKTMEQMADAAAKGLTAEQLVESFGKLMEPLPCAWEDQEQRELRRVVSLEAVKKEMIRRMTK